MKLQNVGSNQTTLELANGTIVFFSYNTPVASFVPGIGFLKTNTKWSKTTSKHINQWLADQGSRKAEERDQEFFDNLIA